MVFSMPCIRDLLGRNQRSREQLARPALDSMLHEEGDRLWSYWHHHRSTSKVGVAPRRILRSHRKAHMVPQRQ